MTLSKFDSEFRNGLGYHQPAEQAHPWESWRQLRVPHSPSVARRETPVYIAENCTQCMECIPLSRYSFAEHGTGYQHDSERAAHSYVSSPEDRVALTKAIPQTTSVHAPLWWKRSHRRKRNLSARLSVPQFPSLKGPITREEFCGIIDQLPMAIVM